VTVKALIAGGGTGGHLFPGIAIAESFKDKGLGDEVLFVGTGNLMEVTTLSKQGFKHVGIAAEGLKERGLWRQIRSLLKVPVGVWQALRVIWRFDPDVVIGLGGYSSGPVALAAKLTGKRLVIHEQNILPGLTNRILGFFANRVCISFPDEFGVFKPSKTVMTGNPIRQELLAGTSGDKETGLFTVLVVGGSQGAHAVNLVVVESLDHLKSPSQMRFIHQTGTKDATWVAQAYESRRIRATVKPFFEDMVGPYSSADLVVCRAGATTVSELMALGKPAIFVPFPFAANNHQELNARYVADAGGAEVILEKDLDGPVLANRLDHFASNPQILRDMRSQTLGLASPRAAEVIVDECRRLLVPS
jgi:UDP-N-acetylglucosamine--N-acetylmuramyl-(pentapeptide) pyrophosphoryl-undecaprenol N-acetylglucosamine transferase